jgi:hypothetical protein
MKKHHHKEEKHDKMAHKVKIEDSEKMAHKDKKKK